MLSMQASGYIKGMPRKGQATTEKHRAAISARLKGRKKSDATRQRMKEANARRGGCPPSCTCGRHKESHMKGKHHTAETKQKLKEAALRQFADGGNRTTHGHSKIGSLTYQTWAAMCRRCTNPRAGNYSYYGGRGIKVCARWDFKQGGSFENFLADVGERPSPAHTLHRIEGGTSNYEPGNVEWSVKPHLPDRPRVTPR
jgi:hypothetical protein